LRSVVDWKKSKKEESQLYSKQMEKQKFTLDSKAALELGEGQFIEFKELFDKILSREMVAFANASDGVIYLVGTDYMELAGTGIKRVTDACVENGNEVNFDFSDSFWLTIKPETRNFKLKFCLKIK
jgi:predicted HTH transcriptional regulator